MVKKKIIMKNKMKFLLNLKYILEIQIYHINLNSNLMAIKREIHMKLVYKI